MLAGEGLATVRVVGMVCGGALFMPPDPGVITRVTEAASAAPDELTMIAMVMRIPPMPMNPAAAHGQLTFLVAVVYAGDPAAGEAAVAPIRAMAPAMVDMIGPMPYPAIFELTKEAAQPAPSAMRAATLARMTPELAATLVAAVGRAPSPAAFVQLRVLGGAMARVPADTTAFAQRDDPLLLFLINVFVGPAPAEAHLAWTESAWAEVRPHGIGVYPNFLEGEGEERIREAYPDGVYERLAAVKRTWDSGNLFRLNQNIRPA